MVVTVVTLISDVQGSYQWRKNYCQLVSATGTAQKLFTKRDTKPNLSFHVLSLNAFLSLPGIVRLRVSLLGSSCK